MDIHGFLALPHRFGWGGVDCDDCQTFLASWCLFAIGIDPAEGLRGTYRTRDEARAIVDCHGGPDAFMNSKLVAIGCLRVGADDARDGDIGLVRITTADETRQPYLATVGAIRFGPLWAMIGPGGVSRRKAIRISSWRLPQ